jgi:hypothetical protein
METDMSELERLQEWMETNDYTIKSLAAETGMSYDGMYQILRARGRISPGFKLRFAERFGGDVARDLFDKPAVAVVEGA